MTEQILRRNEVCRRTGLSRSTIYAEMSAGRFPRNVKISLRAVGWRLSEIDEWITTRIAAGGRVERSDDRTDNRER